jgi:hypothetical protein
MPTSKPFTSTGRDAWGAQHGAGKGDKPRHNQDKFAEGYEHIKWPEPRKRGAGRTFRKVYR